MKKSIAISIISILAVLAIILGISFYSTNTKKSLQISTLETDIADKTGKIETLETDVAGKAGQIETLEADVADKAGQIETLQADVADKAGQIETLQADVADKAGQIETLEADIEEYVKASLDALSEDGSFTNMPLRKLQAMNGLIQAEIDKRTTIPENDGPGAVQIDDLGSLSCKEIIDTCKAIADRYDHLNTFDSFNVPIGTWTVGENLFSGIYSVRQVSNDYNYPYIYPSLAEYGNTQLVLSAQDPSCPLEHIVLNDGDSFEVPFNEIKLAPGILTIQFENADAAGSVIDVSEYNEAELIQIYRTLIAALSNRKDLPKITIPGGIWTVGQDIPAGTYDISAYINSSSGNFDAEVLKAGQYYQKTISLFGYGNERKDALQIVLNEGDVFVAGGCKADLTVSSNNVFFGG